MNQSDFILYRLRRFLIAALPSCVLLAGCTPEEHVQGGTFICALPVSDQALMAGLPIAAIVVGCLLCRNRSSSSVVPTLGAVLAIAGVAALAIWGPQVVLNRVVVDKQHFSVHEGNWWAPCAQDVRFADLEYAVREDKDESLAEYKTENQWRRQRTVTPMSAMRLAPGLYSVSSFVETRQVQVPVYIKSTTSKTTRPYLIFAKRGEVFETILPVEDLLTERAVKVICQDFEDSKFSSQAWRRADFCIEPKSDPDGRPVLLTPEAMYSAYDRMRKTEGVAMVHESPARNDWVSIIYDANTQTVEKLTHPAEFAWNVKVVDVKDVPIDPQQAKEFMIASNVDIKPLEHHPSADAASQSDKQTTLRRADFRIEHPFKYPLAEDDTHKVADVLNQKCPGVLRVHVEPGDQHWAAVVYDGKDMTINGIGSAIKHGTGLTIVDVQDTPITEMPTVVVAGVEKYKQ